MTCTVLSPLFALLVQGPVVSLAVSAIKRIRFVDDHPKIVAAIFAAATTLLAGVAVCGVDVGQIVALWTSAFAGAVATYEVAGKKLERRR